MLIIGIATAVVFLILIAAGLYVTRQAMVSAGNSLGDSAAEDARKLLIEQAEIELSRLVQSKAAVNDEKLAATAEDIRIVSYLATIIKSNPERYGRRNISFPDNSNTEGRITAQLQIPEGTTVGMLQNDIWLMANIQDTLLAIQTHNKNSGTIYVSTESGVTIGADADSALGTPYFEPRTRPWYRAAKQANDLIWTDVFDDYLGRGLAITCVKPFYDAYGNIAGVAGMGMFLNVLKEVVTGTKIGETGYAFIVNEKGEMIISDNITKDEDGKIIRDNILNSDNFPHETALKMVNREKGIAHAIIDGKEKIIAYHGLAAVPWSLAIIIDADEIISPALALEDNIIDLKEATIGIFDRDILWIAVIAAFIFVFVITGVLSLTGQLATDITEPLEKLTVDAARISAGDLDHVLEVKTDDELEILVTALNSMITSIKTITAENERLEIASAEKARETGIIQEANQNLQTILNMLPVGVGVMSTEDHTFLFTNKAFLDVFNCTSIDQILGHSAFEYMPVIQPDGKKTKDKLYEIFQQESATTEMQCVKSGGSPFIARIHAISTEFKGVRGSLGVIEDTTVEKEYHQKLQNIAQQEQEANQLKSRFLATMSHEIRTPLNVILGIMEIQMQKDDNPADTQEALEQIYESGSLLLNIINDILDFSKIAEGKMEIVPFRYDIPSLINDTTQMNHMRCDSRPIEFIVSVDPNTPLELIGDGLRIKQILNNLLSNAFKYTREGEVELSVSYEPTAGDEDAIIVFKIRDTGQGIPQDHVERLFQDYMRINSDINRSVMGTGLGLSITKRLLDLMKGEISVESQSGKGSVFTIRLPQRRYSNAVCGADNARRLRDFNFSSNSISKKTQIVREYMPYGKVLLVDDVRSNLFVARGMLTPYGLNIDSLDNGLEAVEKIKNGNVYDIIFMDHMMPIMDGIEATKIIRGMGYTRPIVALTANAIAGQAQMFLENGFDAFISKPIDSRKLNSILKDFIRDKQTPEVIEAARQEQMQKGAKGKETPADKKKELSELEEIFLIDAGNAVNLLEGLYARINELGEKDMELYRVTVHGCKSALNNVGETKLSETARKLELAAKEKDVAVLSKETPAFIEALKAVIEKMGPLPEVDDA
jgi:signal transduction histidine kinase/DNA-binding response OmpR family regulator